MQMKNHFLMSSCQKLASIWAIIFLWTGNFLIGVTTKSHDYNGKLDWFNKKYVWNNNNGNDMYYQNLDGVNLKDGKQVTVHMQAKQLKEYFFQIREDGSPIWVVVTPCGGIVKWKLTQQVNDGSNENEITDDWFSSGDSSVYNPSYDAFSNKNVSRIPNLKHLQWLEMSSGRSSSGVQPRFLPSKRLPTKESLLVREVGSSTMEYLRDNTPAGNLHLYLVATENDTLARVFVTASDSELVHFFPQLPRRKRVFLSNITTTSVTVHWDDSPSLDKRKQNRGDVEYCLVLSSDKQYPTYCALQQDLLKKNKFSTSEKSNSLNFNPNLGQDNDKMPIVAYIRYKTNYFFDNLQKNTKYHLSLFATNLRTGGSVAYEGASFVTRVEKQDENSAVVMQDGRMYASYLNPTRSSFRLYEFVIDRYQSQVLMTVQPCAGYIRLNLYKDGRVLRKSVFEDLKTLVIFKVKPGVLRVKVINDDSDAKLFKIWASVRPGRNPYPQLPVDTSIKVLEHGRTCRSVTLAWLGSPETQDYCMYKQMEQEEYFKQLILEESNQCRGPPSNKEPVFCRRFRMVNESQLIMKDSIDDLEPATTYRFDLYVSKPYSRQQLSYRTVWVKTKAQCN